MFQSIFKNSNRFAKYNLFSECYICKKNRFSPILTQKSPNSSLMTPFTEKLQEYKNMQNYILPMYSRNKRRICNILSLKWLLITYSCGLSASVVTLENFKIPYFLNY